MKPFNLEFLAQQMPVSYALKSLYFLKYKTSKKWHHDIQKWNSCIGHCDSKYEIINGFDHQNSYFSVFHYINSPPGGQTEKTKANHLYWK